MISYIGKKLLLLSGLMSGVIIGMGLHKGNCIAVPVNESPLCGDVHTVFFFDKENPEKLLFHSDFFNRPIESTDWDNKKDGILHINFEDGNKLEIDVNRPLEDK